MTLAFSLPIKDLCLISNENDRFIFLNKKKVFQYFLAYIYIYTYYTEEKRRKKVVENKISCELDR